MPRLRTPQQSYGPSLGVKKGRKCDLATDLTLPKAIQEQQTQTQCSTAYSDLPRTFLGLFSGAHTKINTEGTRPEHKAHGVPAPALFAVAV
jgi:hypothetical protein